MRLFCHAGLEEPAPYLIRGHPEGLQSTGFRLSPDLMIEKALFESYVMI